jgi:DNA-directed RNA polymerase specialized sigma subunit
MFEYNKYKKELEDILGREPNVEEIKKATGLSYKKINEYENNISNTISLHTKIVTTDRDSSELGDFISDTKDVIPEEIIIKKDPESINVLFVGLTEIEKTIMLLRTGIYNGTEYTLDRIAVILHRLGLKDNTLTREGIRQLEKKAIRKIKVNYEQDALTMSLPEEKKVIKCEKPTLKDFIILLRTTDKEILYNAINALSDRDKIVINECFGMDIVKAKLKKTTPNMIENLLEQVYTRLLYEVNKRVHSKKIREATLPQNIYNIDSTRDKNDVEKQIDELQPFERLVLNKFYDMYTGELRNVTNVTFYEKEQIVIIVDKIRKGLFDVKRTSTRIDDNQEKNTVTRNNLFEYFGLENKEAVLVIISSLEETEISFLKKWYGENYDENPKDKVDYKDMDKLEKARIFNKIRIRLDKYKKLVGQGKTVDINTFVKSKYVDRRSKDNIYTYFENDGYTEEEITQANSELSENDKTLLREYYGSDLKRPIINDYMPEELKRKVLVGIFRKVQKKLEKNKSNKILRKALNND